MAWHQTGDKPLSDPIMAYLIDAYMHYPGRYVFVVHHQETMIQFLVQIYRYGNYCLPYLHN